MEMEKFMEKDDWCGGKVQKNKSEENEQREKRIQRTKRRSLLHKREIYDCEEEKNNLQKLYKKLDILSHFTTALF